MRYFPLVVSGVELPASIVMWWICKLANRMLNVRWHFWSHFSKLHYRWIIYFDSSTKSDRWRTDTLKGGSQPHCSVKPCLCDEALTKVSQLELAPLVDEQVLGLEVAVENLTLVAVRQASEQLEHEDLQFNRERERKRERGRGRERDREREGGSERAVEKEIYSHQLKYKKKAQKPS